MWWGNEYKTTLWGRHYWSIHYHTCYIIPIYHTIEERMQLRGRTAEERRKSETGYSLYWLIAGVNNERLRLLAVLLYCCIIAVCIVNISMQIWKWMICTVAYILIILVLYHIFNIVYHERAWSPSFLTNPWLKPQRNATRNPTSNATQRNATQRNATQRNATQRATQHATQRNASVPDESSWAELGQPRSDRAESEREERRRPDSNGSNLSRKAPR